MIFFFSLLVYPNDVETRTNEKFLYVIKVELIHNISFCFLSIISVRVRGQIPILLSHNVLMAPQDGGPGGGGVQDPVQPGRPAPPDLHGLRRDQGGGGAGNRSLPANKQKFLDRAKIPRFFIFLFFF